MSIDGVQMSPAVPVAPAYRPAEQSFDVNLPEPAQSEASQQDPPEASMPVKKSNEVIQFSADAVSGKMMMKVVDPESGETVRQIPPEDMVAISRVLGLLFDRVA